MILPETAASLSTAPSSSGERPAYPHPPDATTVRPLPAVVDAGLSSPQKPKKKRVSLKPPKDSRVYKVAMAYVALKAQGKKLSEIAEILNLPKDTVSTYVKRAHQRGWVNRNSFIDPEDQLDVVLKSDTIRNVAQFLNDEDKSVRKEVTLEAAKGLGIFKNHQAIKTEGQQNIGFALKVDVVMPQAPVSSSPVVIRPGSVGGQPAIEGELVEDGGDQWSST